MRTDRRRARLRGFSHRARLRGLTHHADSRGFTLLEVLIAIALMAVLAVLGWRGLDSILVTRERLTRSSDDLKALSVCFAQMEEDLRRAWPVRLLNLPVPVIGFAVAGEGDGAPPLQLLREPPAGTLAGTVQRVSYRLRADVLERGFAPWAAVSAESAASQPAQSLTWQPLVGQVSRLRMRGFVAGIGWADSATLAARPQSTAAPVAPGLPVGAQVTPTLLTGLEVTLERSNGERIIRIFPVKD